MSAVVVDLPLVPVMATNGVVGVCARRSRQNSSMSPITSTAAACANPTDQCGTGSVSGTPGASTSAEILDQSMWRRSAVGVPPPVALGTVVSGSAPPPTSAQPAHSELLQADRD